ncbi:lipopolysaccharide heptosyltransferase II [Candidatus Omnitrophota bacterium]
MEKILLVNVNWLGDVLFSTPVIKALKKAYPESKLACMVVPRCREVLDGNPYIDEIILFDEKTLHRNIFKRLKFINSLRKKQFTKAFILHRSLTRALIVFLAGIPERIGYNTKKRGFLLTKKIALPGSDMHRSDQYLNVIESYGISVEDRTYDFFVSDDNRAYAEKLFREAGIAENDFVVVINPGGNWDPKRWLKENFAAVADQLIQRYHAKVIIAGATKDIALAWQIRDLMQEQPILITGKTTLKQLAAAMQKAHVVISADSGPAHIASAVGAGVIMLFGPTLPKITGPRGKNKVVVLHKDLGCSLPCYDSSCVDYRCMKAIMPEDVLHHVQEFKS